MKPRRPRELRTALDGKGFRPRENDHTYYHFYDAGLKTGIWTKISYSRREYGDRLLGLVATQLHLRNAELEDLLDCPLSEEEYRLRMSQRGFI